MEQFFARLFEMLSDLQRQSSSPLASLERSISAAHHAHASARHALAIAMAEETRESARRTALAAKASDLEQRAVAALQAGREDLAAQAAEAIAAIASMHRSKPHSASLPRWRWRGARSPRNGADCRNWIVAPGSPGSATP